MFSGCTLPPDSKKTKLGSSDQEASPSTEKNIRVVSVPCSRMEVCPTTISGHVNISEVAGCHLLQDMNSQCESKKIISRIGVS